MIWMVLPKEAQVANKYMKKKPNIFIQQGKLHWDSISLRQKTIIKKIKNNCWRGCKDRGTVTQGGWEYKLACPVWKTVWKVLKKLSVGPPSDLATPLMGEHPKEMTSAYKRYTCILIFFVPLFTVVKLWISLGACQQMTV